MQHRTLPPSTQSGTSVNFRALILVLSKHFFCLLCAFFFKQRRPKTRTPTRHRRIITPRSDFGTFSARLVFWKAGVQARTLVPLSGAFRSRRARPVRILHGAFHTTETTGSANKLPARRRRCWKEGASLTHRTRPFPAGGKSQAARNRQGGGWKKTVHIQPPKRPLACAAER